MDSLGIINEYTGKKNFVKADSMGVYKLQVDSTDVKADALRIYRQHDGKMVDSFFMSKIELEQAKNDVFEIAGSILPEIQINSAKPIHTSNFIATGRTETGILSVVNHLQRIQSPYPQNPISNPITEPYPNAKIPLKQSPKVEFGTYDSPGIDPNPRERR